MTIPVSPERDAELMRRWGRVVSHGNSPRVACRAVPCACSAFARAFKVPRDTVHYWLGEGRHIPRGWAAVIARHAGIDVALLDRWSKGMPPPAVLHPDPARMIAGLQRVMGVCHVSRPSPRP